MVNDVAVEEMCGRHAVPKLAENGRSVADSLLMVWAVMSRAARSSRLIRAGICSLVGQSGVVGLWFFRAVMQLNPVWKGVRGCLGNEMVLGAWFAPDRSDHAEACRYVVDRSGDSAFPVPILMGAVPAEAGPDRLRVKVQCRQVHSGYSAVRNPGACSQVYGHPNSGPDSGSLPSELCRGSGR